MLLAVSLKSYGLPLSLGRPALVGRAVLASPRSILQAVARVTMFPAVLAGARVASGRISAAEICPDPNIHAPKCNKTKHQSWPNAAFACGLISVMKLRAPVRHQKLERLSPMTDGSAQSAACFADTLRRSQANPFWALLCRRQ